MSSNQNSLLIIGAALVGIVGAAGMYLVERYRQEKRRHAMAQDLARLDRQLTNMREELDQLRQMERNKATSKSKRDKLSRPSSRVSSTATDEYGSATELDSSDSEFYDVSDEEEVGIQDRHAAEEMAQIDKNLEEANIAGIESVLDQLEEACRKRPDDLELLWRMAKAHHKMYSLSEQDVIKQRHLNMGIAMCERALELSCNSAEVHKWYAILIGSRSDFQPMKERIADGYLFKKHVDEAIRINPNDASLHHMLGRFAYEIAGLKWYERKVAATLFGDPPSATYTESLKSFMMAEKLSSKGWKENKLMVAKCHEQLINYKAAIDWLLEAEKTRDNYGMDDKLDPEIKSLLAKYNSYR